MIYPVCPCDGANLAAPINLPGLAHIIYRGGTYADFRRAVLTPLFAPALPQPLPVEQTLSRDGVPVWQADGAGDLAVMMAEWFAYIAEIVTFYNERIANQAYLRTADLPESVAGLVALLGYRPRPAIGATASLAALVSSGPTFGGRSIVLPKGLQFQSKPAPGQAPQTFELSADTAIGTPDQLPATPPPQLLAQVAQAPVWYRHLYHIGYGGYGSYSVPAITYESGSYSLFLQGAVKTIDPGALLRLRPRDSSMGDPMLATVTSATIQPAPSGTGQQTSLVVTLSAAPPDGITAAQASLESANQNTSVWDIFDGAIDGKTVHLASLVRQIRPGHWLLFTSGSQSVLAKIASIADVIWDATGSADNPNTPSDPQHPVPIPHTKLTLTEALPSWDAKDVTIAFDWVSVGNLINQPFAPWSGSPTTLVGTSAKPFPAWSTQSILLQDATGLGITATASSAGDANVALGALQDPVPELQAPFQVFPNVLQVTRGKTVSNEILGSGDATNPAQDFPLSQSPVTYLQQGTGCASTIALTVNGEPWSEVASFYGQKPNATVFVTREDDSGKTHVMFGDGVNGARLPTGTNNVVATYRTGAGAASPAAGKLTAIAKPFPGLRSVLNPVAASGGSDADPPDQIRRYAPRSVLTFGRAVSVFDYEALAAQAPGVTRARAAWCWNDARQRSLVTVYVGDDSGAAASARKVLAAAGDPNRPVVVVQATPVAVALTLTLVVTPGFDPDAIAAAVSTALTDPQTGLFGAWMLAIGQPIFDSQIEAAVLAVNGTVALTAMSFLAGGATDAGPLHNPGEGAFYTLDPADLFVIQEPDPNG